MARHENDLETVRITISTTPGVRDYLVDCVRTQLFGKNSAEAAVRLIERGIDGLVKDGTLQKRKSFAKD